MTSRARPAAGDAQLELGPQLELTIKAIAERVTSLSRRACELSLEPASPPSDSRRACELSLSFWQVEVTINGIGERAGNAALEEVVMALHVRKQYYNPMLGRDAMDQNALTNINMKEIYRSSKLVTSMTGMFVQVSLSLARARALSPSRRKLVKWMTGMFV